MGKKTSKTTSTSTPWAPAQPILTGAGNSILNTVNGNAGNLSNIESGITGGTIPGLQQQIANQGQQLQPGYNYLNATLGGQYLNSNPANSYLAQQANGQYLNSNPYTQAMANQAGQAAGNAVNSTFSLAGRTGSDNHATDLARGVDQAQNQVYFQNYQNERGLQNQAIGQLGQNYNTALGMQGNAAGMLPGYGTSQFAGYQPLLGAQQLAGQLPYYGAQAASGVGSLFGGYGTQTGTQPGGWGNTLGGILGAGLGGWASGGFAMPSDIRLKTNVEKVGEAKDGLGIYEWNWKAEPNGQKVRGVLAHEVEKLRPWAHVPNFRDDYAGVNYASLGSLA